MIEFGLLAAALVAVASAGVFVWWQKQRDAALPDLPFERIVGAILVGLGAGRLVELALLGINPLTEPAQLLFLRGGVDTVAASVAATTALVYPLRSQLSRLDGLAPAAVAGVGGWHLGCLSHGSCLGTVSELPWAMTLAGSSTERHPVELYASLSLFLAALVLMRLRARAGTVAALSVAAIGGTRLVTEPLRLTIGSGLWAFYLGATVLGLAGAYWFNTSSRARSFPEKKSSET